MLARLFFVVQMLCFVIGFTTAQAQNNTRLSTREVSPSSPFYSRQAARVAHATVYTVQPDFLFTSLSVRIPTSETFEGAYVVHRQDTFYLRADEHGATDTAYQSASLVVLDQPIEAVLFYPATIRGEITFSFFNATGEKKSLNQSLRTKEQTYRSNACAEPALVPPDEWRAGLPPPSYNRRATDVEHVIVHHSATYNDLTDYENVVRNIYLFHTQERKWSDIGYNYLIAQDGTVFGGRSPGLQSVERDNIQGAHFCGRNSGTMGICLLGNYNTAVPTDTALTSLVKLAGWKLNKEALNPRGEQRHPTNASLPTLAGHRDGCATECPGDNLYARLGEIRTAVAQYIADGCTFAPEAPVSLLIYPVPVQETLTVALPDTVSLETVAVYDMAGRTREVPIAQNTERPGTIELDTRLLATGLYVLRLSGDGWEERRKIVVR